MCMTNQYLFDDIVNSETIIKIFSTTNHKISKYTNISIKPPLTEA